MPKENRGGHNRKKINEKFFKNWTPKMAYVLGFITADGTILNSSKSSRTCYLSLSSVDKEIILKIKHAMKSKHNIYRRLPSEIKIRGRYYTRAQGYVLRIGNKNMFQDLLNLGPTSRKSLTITMPKIPKLYFKFFLRGYFEGDGCINICNYPGYQTTRLKTVFTSGCEKFLIDLAKRLKDLIRTGPLKVFRNSNAFRLVYNKNDSIKLLNFIYDEPRKAPFLIRKYRKYLEIKSHNNLGL